MTTTDTEIDKYQRANDMIAAGVNEALVSAWLDAKHDEEFAAKTLAAEARSMAERLLRIAEKVEAGDTVNSLGELQARGPGFDVRCAEYQRARKHAEQLAYVIERMGGTK